ncbi:hypothetical protein [Enterococcus faecalis]|uniref:hypothetical protein n=1 Tax=Enterococcus faecalis TaxID=1351 RepID=UPI0040414C41
MNKIHLLGIFFIITVILSSCSSSNSVKITEQKKSTESSVDSKFNNNEDNINDVTSESSAINYIEKNGMSSKQSKNYYGYVNSLRLLLVSLSDIDESIAESKKIDFELERTKINASLNIASSYYQEIVKDYEDGVKFLTSTDSFSPLYILNNMKSYYREMSTAEKGIIITTLNSMTKKSLKELNLSIKERQNLYSYFKETCYSNNVTFKYLNKALE